MKLWIDDIRPAPPGYTQVKSVNEAIYFIANRNIVHADDTYWTIALIDIDHDAGDYVNDGGDYIKLLDWMEYNDINDIPIHIHSMNPVGVQNMRAIIQRNGWKEV